MRYPSHIYVMSAPDGLVKVGLSRQLDGRIKALSTDHRPVALEWATPRHHDPLTVEMTAHTLLASSHAKGEWFSASVEEAIAAVSQAVGMIDLGDKSKRRRARYDRRPSTKTRKGEPMGIRMDPAEMTALSAAAKSDMRSVSSMARKLIVDHLRNTGFLVE